MCGRFALTATPEVLKDHFRLRHTPEIKPRYNIAPSQQIAVIVVSSGMYKQLKMMRWGLIPSWAKDHKIGYKLINARAETVAEKPAFRSAYQKRRCLIPASGFFEWLHQGKSKIPHYITMKGGHLFSMAGIWESWIILGGEVLESCSIVTTESVGLIRKVHDRMPVIIQSESYGLWLSPTSLPPEEFLRPPSPFLFTLYPVSGMVNDPKNDAPGCIAKRNY